MESRSSRNSRTLRSERQRIVRMWLGVSSTRVISHATGISVSRLLYTGGSVGGGRKTLALVDSNGGQGAEGGAVSGHQVMLMVDDGVQHSLSLNLLLTSPTVLLHTTTHNTNSLCMPSDLTKVYGWLSPRAVLVLVAAQTCSARKHFQSPLLQNTPSVVLPRLNHKPQTPEYSTYSVKIHFPFPEPLSLGTWHPDTFATYEDLLRDQFQDFSGKLLRVTMSLHDACTLLFERDNGQVDGICTRIMASMSEWLNYTYSLTSATSVWRKRLENSSWDGIQGKVQRGENQLVINYFTITYERVQDFDYSISYFTEGTLHHYPTGRVSFTPTRALCGGVVIVATFAYYFVNFRGVYLSLLMSFLIVFQSLLSQSVSQESQVWVSRGLLATWVLRVSYTSNLMAFLTVPALPPPLHTLEQLADTQFR
ncbi:hypothetical protein Pcinc_005207 [Petrolisthes cinctipes]|uniref:Ionotropic glutamate receptor L-glutamate and glycine-binding domain-containing protein n=1 Tax=Petrolisthes cinctipes TaxID=88211 RepID=A0AAE1GD69_PETCI|nr:hypothetical protein Pcinc_005207 [Petrolisthes cinctipes]